MPAESVRLTDPAAGATADVLVSLGFNCFSWRAPFTDGGQPRELLWAEPGFAEGDKRPSRSGIPLLAPFAGRIQRGRYRFEGRDYQLPEEDGMGNAIHGFALRSAWRVTNRADDRVTADYQLSRDTPDAADGWPSDFRLTATYAVEGRRLVFDLAAENVGDGPLPFGFGTHAYFRLPLADGADPEATLVHADVDAEWATEGLIPTGATLPIADGNPLPSGGALAGAEFDTPYRFASGVTTTEVRDPATGHAVRQTFDDSMTACVVYTPDHREAICLEPYTCLPNPFALEEAGVASGLRVLGPG
ncbi:MAG: aldose 1-epimerase, partial [Planctomycetota bacterium]